MGLRHRRHGKHTQHAPKGPISRHELFDHGMKKGSGDSNDIVIADYVIVGAGTAGAPLAKLLSDDRSVSVHVIEAGLNRNDDPNVLSASTAIPNATDPLPEYHWYFPADPRPFPPANHNGPLFGYTQGKMWGGSSGHNYLLSVRGTPAVYNRWAELGCNAIWRYENVRGAFIFLETYTSLITGVVNPAERGTAGPLFITQGALVPVPVSPTGPFVDALATVGVAYSPDYNDPSRGVYVFGDYQNFVTPPPNVQRSFAGTAFLNEDVVTEDADGNGVGVGGRQLFIDSEAVAIRLLFDDDFTEDEVTALDREFGLGWSSACSVCRKSHKSRCHCNGNGCPAELTVRGVRYIAGDRIVDALAREKVILSAGALGNVQILERSGIGPREVLDRIGIDVRLENPHVGRFQNHLLLPFSFSAGPGAPGAFTGFLPGPGSGPDGPREYQIIAALGFFGDPTSISGIIIPLQPPFNGFAELRERAFPGNMLVKFNPAIDPADQATIIDAYLNIARISVALTGTLPSLPPPAVFPAAEFAAQGGEAPNTDALLAFARGVGSFTNHISGTARMSCSPADGVVDGNLDVWNVCNLGIADLSVAPLIADGNTTLNALLTGLIKAKIEGARVPF